MMDPPYSGPKMEARQAHGSAPAVVLREPTPEELLATVLREPEFQEPEEGGVYGWRIVETEGENGVVTAREVPLRWMDLFDPKEGDRLMISRKHARTTHETRGRLEGLFQAQGRDAAVFDDVRIDWKTPGVPPACPDVMVVPNVEKREPEPTSFNEEEEGTSPCFVLEVTSKKTAKYDRESKPSIYRRGKVPEVFLLDAMKTPWTLSAQRRDPETKRYRKVRPDARGRLLSETLGVYFSISESGDDLVLEDAVTGEVLLKPVEESLERRAAEQRADAAEARLREALAEIERLKGTSAAG